LRINRVHLIETDQPVQRLSGEEVTAGKHHDGCLIEADLVIGLEFEEVNTSIAPGAASLAIFLGTRLPAQSWALVATVECPGASLVAWETVARRSTWHGACPLMFAPPWTLLDARGTRIRTFQCTS
jgi:hypothetical protein